MGADFISTAHSAAPISAPIINTRAADTVVVTPDGQTVIIGGMMSNAKGESVSKIPYLGDIPLLGALFRRTTKTDYKDRADDFPDASYHRRAHATGRHELRQEAGKYDAPKTLDRKGDSEIPRGIADERTAGRPGPERQRLESEIQERLVLPIPGLP